MPRLPLHWLALTALVLTPLAAAADPAPAPTRVEVARAQDGSRFLLKLPKPCQTADEAAAVEAKKKLAGQSDIEYVAGYWCYGDVEGTELSAVVVILYASAPPPPTSEFERACGMPLHARLAWLRQHFGDFGNLKVSDTRCDSAKGRITLLGSDPRIKTLDVARMTLVPGAKGVMLLNVMYGSKTAAQSLRASLEGLAETVAIREPPASAPASPSRP